MEGAGEVPIVVEAKADRSSVRGRARRQRFRVDAGSGECEDESGDLDCDHPDLLGIDTVVVVRQQRS